APGDAARARNAAAAATARRGPRRRAREAPRLRARRSRLRPRHRRARHHRGNELEPRLPGRAPRRRRRRRQSRREARRLTPMDKITYEIIRSGLYAIAREMKIAMMRTAASPIIHSGGDASAAIFDAKMQLVAQGNDIPTMLGSAVISTRASVG